MTWWHWWLVINLICWVGGWAILQTVLIEVFARLVDSCCMIVALVWTVALLLATGLVLVAPGLFVLPVWANWLREGREP